MSAITPQRVDFETANVTRWRLQELLRAGYTWDQAVLLAARVEIDLHRAVELIRHGCPAETALRILL